MNSLPPDYDRLDEQIDWLDRRAAQHQHWYRTLKLVSIVAAALVPLASAASAPAVVAGALGVVVVIVEGVQHINQHHDTWLRYRGTCEQLRSEKQLFAGGAGAYEGLLPEQAQRQLIAAVEAILARESGQWLQLRQGLERDATDQPPSA